MNNSQVEADALAILDKQEVATDGKNKDVSYALTTDKGYHRLKRYANVTSYSILQELHACPRRLLIQRYAADSGEQDSPVENIHFAFGHSVGAGVQSLLQTGNLQTALLNSFLAWRIDFNARLDKKKKSIWEASIAVEKFNLILQESLAEWELVVVNGKPAIELAFELDCGNGYYHYGHIDAIIRNKATKEVAVLELKTTGLTSAEEALYGNSSQALGYSVILDTIFPGLTSYEVFHMVYSSTEREWTALPFLKTTGHKAEWIKDLLLDQAVLEKYQELQFYPKRGESCFNYFRRCDYYGICNTLPDKELPMLEDGAAEDVDFSLKLEDVIKAQQARVV